MVCAILVMFFALALAALRASSRRLRSRKNRPSRALLAKLARRLASGQGNRAGRAPRASPDRDAGSGQSQASPATSRPKPSPLSNLPSSAAKTAPSPSSSRRSSTDGVASVTLSAPATATSANMGSTADSASPAAPARRSPLPADTPAASATVPNPATPLAAASATATTSSSTATPTQSTAYYPESDDGTDVDDIGYQPCGGGALGRALDISWCILACAFAFTLKDVFELQDSLKELAQSCPAFDLLGDDADDDLLVPLTTTGQLLPDIFYTTTTTTTTSSSGAEYSAEEAGELLAAGMVAAVTSVIMVAFIWAGPRVLKLMARAAALCCRMLIRKRPSSSPAATRSSPSSASPAASASPPEPSPSPSTAATLPPPASSPSPTPSTPASPDSAPSSTSAPSPWSHPLPPSSSSPSPSPTDPAGASAPPAATHRRPRGELSGSSRMNITCQDSPLTNLDILKAFMDKPKLPLGLNVLVVIVSLVVVAVVVLERLDSSHDAFYGDASATDADVFTSCNASTLLLHLPAAAAPVRVSFTGALPSAAAAGAWASASPAVLSIKELAAPLLATLAVGLAVLPLCTLAALGIERLAARGVPPQAESSASPTSTDSLRVSRSERHRHGAIAVAADWAAILLHVANTSASLVVPHAAIALSASSPLKLPVGVALSMLSIIVWMKLVSYAHCNTCLRAAARSCQRALTSSPSDAPLSSSCSDDTANSAANDSSSLEAGVLAYPRNLTLRDAAYYLAAPTLTYQPGFPLSPGRPRLMWLLRRAIELAATCAVIVYLSSAHVAPLVRRSANPLALLAQTHAGLQQSGFEALLDVSPQWCQLLATLLRLSMFTLTVWLCMFYALFHLWLNMLAEALRFGDRQFYLDWWNAGDVGEFWRRWNKPVNTWMLRTVYSPLRRLRVSRFAAQAAAFFVSAVFHELVLSAPLSAWNHFAFLGMLSQVPLAAGCDGLRRVGLCPAWFGNALFWTATCIIGQPLALLLYFHAAAV